MNTKDPCANCQLRASVDAFRNDLHDIKLAVCGDKNLGIEGLSNQVQQLRDGERAKSGLISLVVSGLIVGLSETARKFL